MKCEVSIIIPVYNSEKYLQRCFDSIINQTFSNFEVILVNDGSTDNSGEICEKYTSIDSRFSVIHQENRGQAAARNKAIKKACGNWICFIDSDDCISSIYLEALYNAVINNNAQISMCGALEGKVVPQYDNRIDVSTFTIDELRLVDLLENGEHRYWVVWGKLIARQIVANNLFVEGRIYEDNEVVCKWLVEAGVVADISTKLYFYYENENSTTKKTFSIKQLDRLWALDEQIKFYEQKQFRIIRNKIIKRYILAVTNCYLTAKNECDDRKIHKEIKKLLFSKIRKYHKEINLLSSEKIYVCEALFSRLMVLYWKILQIKKFLQKNKELN